MKVGNIVPYIYSTLLVFRILTFMLTFQNKKSRKKKFTNLVNLHLILISFSTVNDEIYRIYSRYCIVHSIYCGILL